MSENTFKICTPKGKRGASIEYRPLIYKCGAVSHRFALHLDFDRTNTMPETFLDWVISDPISGKKVRTVTANHKGLVCASRGMTPGASRDAAIATLDFLVSKIGVDKFNATIEAGRIAA